MNTDQPRPKQCRHSRSHLPKEVKKWIDLVRVVLTAKPSRSLLARPLPDNLLSCIECIFLVRIEAGFRKCILWITIFSYLGFSYYWNGTHLQTATFFLNGSSLLRAHLVSFLRGGWYGVLLLVEFSSPSCGVRIVHHFFQTGEDT